MTDIWPYFFFLWVVLDGKSSQEYPVNAGVLQGSILGCKLFQLYINDLPNDLCNITICADDTTLHSKCDQASDLWQPLELTLELQSDLWETLRTGAGSGLLISMLEKLNQFLLTSLKALVIDLKMDGSVLEEKWFFKIRGLTFSSKLDWGSFIISITKSSSKKIGVVNLFYEFSFSLGWSVSINLPYGHVWNIVVISGLVLLVATWNCWISYRNKYAGLLVLCLLPLLCHWLIVEMLPA